MGGPPQGKAEDGHAIASFTVPWRKPPQYMMIFLSRESRLARRVVRSGGEGREGVLGCWGTFRKSNVYFSRRLHDFPWAFLLANMRNALETSSKGVPTF